MNYEPIWLRISSNGATATPFSSKSPKASLTAGDRRPADRAERGGPRTADRAERGGPRTADRAERGGLRTAQGAVWDRACPGLLPCQYVPWLHLASTLAFHHHQKHHAHDEVIRSDQIDGAEAPMPIYSTVNLMCCMFPANMPEHQR